MTLSRRSGTPEQIAYSSEPALAVSDLRAGYGKVPILHHVSLSAREGEVVAVLGPNGSGKSTFIKVVYGLATRYAGTISYFGRDIGREPPEVLARLGLGYVPQRDNVFMSLTVQENLDVGLVSCPRPLKRERLEWVFELFPILRERRHQQARTLSGGERQMLAMARALLTKPSVLLLDEPAAALSRKVAAELFQTVQTIAEQGVAVVLAEQNARQALRICHRAYVFISGAVAFTGTGEEIEHNKEVVRHVLGGAG